MSPAATDNTCDAAIALNYDPHPNTNLAAIGAADFKGAVPLVIARAMMQEHRRQQNDAEIAAILRARHIEARKEEELDLARAIRRHHEDEQIQKQLLSMRERELIKRDNEPLTMAISGGEDSSLLSEATSKKRRLEGDLLLRSVLQRKQLSRYQNTIPPRGSRLLPLSSYENGLVTLSSSSQTSLSQPLSLLSSLSPLTSPFIEDQASSAAERLHGRTKSQYNRTDCHIDRSQAILNSLYSSTPGPITSSQDIVSLRKYYDAVNASSFTGSGNMHGNMPTPGTNLQSIAHTGAGAGVGADWLHDSSRKQEKHGLEGQGCLIIGSERTKTAANLVGENDDNGGEQEGEQQQKRFNKHQVRQWTLKFHELLAFKDRMGHCNVPHGYKDNLALAMWVKRQRHQYNLMVEKKTSTLTGERIRLLENIGFVWNCLETAWEQHFQDLRHFVVRTGHCAVPSTYKRNSRLASWVVTQRRQCKLLEDGKQSSMTPKRFEKLKKIGFPVKTKKAGTTKNLKK